MTDNDARDEETDYPRHTPDQAEGEDVKGGTDPKDGANPPKPSQAEGSPEAGEKG